MKKSFAIYLSSSAGLYIEMGTIPGSPMSKAQILIPISYISLHFH